jgi:hypothetical protein
LNYFNSSQAGVSDQIVLTDGLSNNRKENIGVTELQSNEELLRMQNYGEIGSRLKMYESSMQGR